jgi:ribonuclease HI
MRLIEIYTDGASKGNPGESGIGIVLKNGPASDEYAYYIGEYSNHEAEFLAVIKGLELCKVKYPNEILSFRTDSQVVVDTVEKEFTKNKRFSPLLKKIIELSKDFPLFFIKWIPEKQNQQADRLARSAIHSKK